MTQDNKATLEQMFELQQNAIQNGDVALIGPRNSNFLRSGAGKLSRAAITEVWVMPEALECNDYSNLEVAHVGNVQTRVTRYNNGWGLGDTNATELVIFESTVIAVLDMAENNDGWDVYGELTTNQKRELLISMGASVIKPDSKRGAHGFDDVKRNWERIKGL